MGSLFKLHRLRFKMRSLVLLLAPLAMAATMGSNKGRESRHFWGQNMTVPRSFQNMGSINIAGVGDVYVVTQDPSTVQMVDNGFWSEVAESTLLKRPQMISATPIST